MSGHGHGHTHGGGATSTAALDEVRTTPRARRVLVVLSAVVLVASLLAVGLLWPRASDAGARAAAGGGASSSSGTVEPATVVWLHRRTCAGTAVDQLPDGSVPRTVACPQVRARLRGGPDRGRERTVTVPPQIERTGLRAGSRVELSYYPGDRAGSREYAWYDVARGRPLLLIVGVFALAVVLVGRRRGASALVGLVLAYAGLAWFVLPALQAGEHATVVALAGSGAIISVVLYLAHGFSLRTATAHLGTAAGLVLAGALAPLGVHLAHLQGMDGADSATLATLSGLGDLTPLVLAGIVVAGLGALNDVTTTQASAVWELAASDPGADARLLFTRALRIGRDHLASATYTLAFAYAGASLPTLLLLHLDGAPLGAVLTSSAIAEEVVRTAVGGVCLVAAVPLTTAIAVAAVGRRASAAAVAALAEPAVAPDGAAQRRHRPAAPALVDLRAPLVDLRDQLPARRGRHAAP